MPIVCSGCGKVIRQDLDSNADILCVACKRGMDLMFAGIKEHNERVGKKEEKDARKTVRQ